MTKTRVAMLLALVAGFGLSGCGDGRDEAAFLVDWQLFVVGGREGLTCEQAGTPRVALETVNLRTAERSRDTFPCTAGRGVSRELSPGSYDVTVSLEDDTGQVVSDITETFIIDRRGVTNLGTVQFEIQSFKLDWTLSRAGTSVSCAQAGAQTVRLTARLGETEPSFFEFPCADHSGITQAIATGTYSLRVDLIGTGGQALSQVPAMTFVVGSDRLAVIPPITFDVP